MRSHCPRPCCELTLRPAQVSYSCGTLSAAAQLVPAFQTDARFRSDCDDDGMRSDFSEGSY